MKSMIAANLVGHIAPSPAPSIPLRHRLRAADHDLPAGLRRGRRPVLPRPRVKAVTYDTRLAQIVARDYKTGDFVQILADDVRVERAWKNNQGNWISGSAVLLMTRIRKVTALTAGEQPAGNTAGNPPAENAGTRAEASVLDGVRVSDRAAEAEPELAAAS